MKLTILGSGTSFGVPVIACDCKVCKSDKAQDKRLRASALLCIDNKNFLIDVGPDFRTQALRAKLHHLDAVFLTHSHADHIHGIDDLRIFSHKNSGAMNSDKEIAAHYPETAGAGLAMYMNSESLDHVKKNFHYIFMNHEKGGGTPKLNLVSVDNYSARNPLLLGNLQVVPILMVHGFMNTTGWVFTQFLPESMQNLPQNEQTLNQTKKHSIAYLTDCNFISDESIERVKNAVGGGVLDHLVIDALRVRPHSTHNSFDQALLYADKIGAVHTWFTHMSHDFFHTQIQEYIDKNLDKYKNLKKIVLSGGTVSPAFDGLELFT